MCQMIDKDNAVPVPDKSISTHTVIKFTIQQAEKKCPLFRTGDFYYVRQHILDTEVSSIGNFCYHTLADLYAIYCRIRKSDIGSFEVFDCRDKSMVQFQVERLADEHAPIGRSVVKV